MAKKLTEELNVYIDDDTGDEYVFDGTKLVKIKIGQSKIGDKGDADIQAREEAERNEAAKAGGVIEDTEELEARIKRLEKALDDSEVAKEITKEADGQVAKERIKKEIAKSERELKEFRNDPVVQFEGSLNHFIKKQLKMVEEQTYTRFNRRYEGTDFVMKGIKRYESEEMPLVNVYFDRSGSWGEDKTKVGRQALATLDKYVRAGKLKVNIKYFNTKIFTEYTENGSGGTRGTPILADVLADKPDNVIVMTDSDITDCNEYVQVPGVVWYLFSGGRSSNLETHLTGKMATESYNLDTSN